MVSIKLNDYLNLKNSLGLHSLPIHGQRWTYINVKLPKQVRPIREVYSNHIIDVHIHKFLHF